MITRLDLASSEILCIVPQNIFFHLPVCLVLVWAAECECALIGHVWGRRSDDFILLAPHAMAVPLVVLLNDRSQNHETCSVGTVCLVHLYLPSMFPCVFYVFLLDLVIPFVRILGSNRRRAYFPGRLEEN